MVKARSAATQPSEGEQVSNGVRTVKQRPGFPGLFIAAAPAAWAAGGGRGALSGGQRDLEAQPHADQFDDITGHQIAVSGERVAIDVGRRDTLALAQLPPRQGWYGPVRSPVCLPAQRD